MLLSGCSSALGFIFQTSQVARGSVGCNCFRHSSLFQSHFTYLFSVSPDGRRRKERKHQDTRYKQIPNLKLQISNRFRAHELSEVTSRFRAALTSVPRISPQTVGRFFAEYRRFIVLGA